MTLLEGQPEEHFWCIGLAAVEIYRLVHISVPFGDGRTDVLQVHPLRPLLVSTIVLCAVHVGVWAADQITHDHLVVGFPRLILGISHLIVALLDELLGLAYIILECRRVALGSVRRRLLQFLLLYGRRLSGNSLLFTLSMREARAGAPRQTVIIAAHVVTAAVLWHRGHCRICVVVVSFATWCTLHY